MISKSVSTCETVMIGLGKTECDDDIIGVLAGREKDKPIEQLTHNYSFNISFLDFYFRSTEK